MFELKQLRCFVAVAEELHFGRAATEMNMTQSPFSRQIKLLEEGLGVQLLDRDNRNVRLTPPGRAFLADARHILASTEMMAAATRQTAAGEVGSIRLGFMTTAGFSLMPEIVMRCRNHLPKVALTLQEMSSQDQMVALEAGQIDIGLIWPQINPLTCQMRLASESLVAAFPSNDPRLSKSSLQVSDFHGRPFVMYAKDTANYLHSVVGSLFEKKNCAPHFVQYTSNAHAILGMVGSGMGAALVPQAATRLHPTGVEFRPLRDMVARVELYGAWDAENANPAIAKFLDVIRPTPQPRVTAPVFRIAASG
ncbi:MAG TPA: LysR family transcriptional regulator [Rhizomicrobium sp.]|jgi:DNA-binding transcriptional LysR family regulator